MQNSGGNYIGVVEVKNSCMVLTKPKKSRENHLKMVWDDIFFCIKWKRMGTYLQVLWRRALRSKTISLIGDLVWKAGCSSSRTNANYCTSVRIISWAMKDRNRLARQKLQKKNCMFYWREHQLPNSYCCEGDKKKTNKEKNFKHLVSKFGYWTSNKIPDSWRDCREKHGDWSVV